MNGKADHLPDKFDSNEHLSSNFEIAHQLQLTAIMNVDNLFRGGRDLDSSIEKVINAGVLPNVVECLGSSDHQIQGKAIWVLHNMSSGTPKQIEALVEAGAIPKLLNLFDYADEVLLNGLIYSLEKIALNGADFCNVLYKNEVIKYLWNAIMSKNSKWSTNCLLFVSPLIRCLCQNLNLELEPESDIYFLQMLARLSKLSNVKITSYVVQALFCICEKTGKLDGLFKYFEPEFIVSMIGSDDYYAKKYSILIVEKIFKEKKGHVLMDCGVIGALDSCLGDETLQKNILSCLLHIAEGPCQNVQMLLENGILNKIFDFLDNSNLCCHVIDIWARVIMCRNLDDLAEKFVTWEMIGRLWKELERCKVKNKKGTETFLNRMELLTEKVNRNQMTLPTYRKKEVKSTGKAKKMRKQIRHRLTNFKGGLISWLNE